jgi:hypothetical protein
MALRLVLVSVVAGLGLTLPTGIQVGDWQDAAHSWVNERLAEWDARMPADENAFVLVAEPAPPQAVAIPANLSPATDGPISEVVAVTAPETSATDAMTVPAIDFSEGLEAPNAPAAIEEADVVAEVSPSLKTEDLDAAFGVAQGDVIAGFAADQLARVATAEVTVPVADRPVGPPRFEPLEIKENLYEGVAYDLNREAEGLTLVVTTVAPKASPAVPRFEPMQVADDLYEGVAYALNREADGLSSGARNEVASGTIAKRAEKPQSSGEHGRLTHAVRLTREAVFAWANLLHGPAVVTLAH